MKAITYRMVQSLCVLEFLFFGYMYVYGSNGVIELRSLGQENAGLKAELDRLEEEQKRLEAEVESWTNNPFKVEKYAREVLQMSRPGDAIYMVMN